jgi:hypothetical protein
MGSDSLTLPLKKKFFESWESLTILPNVSSATPNQSLYASNPFFGFSSNSLYQSCAPLSVKNDDSSKFHEFFGATSSVSRVSKSHTQGVAKPSIAQRVMQMATDFVSNPQTKYYVSATIMVLVIASLNKKATLQLALKIKNSSG